MNSFFQIFCWVIILGISSCQSVQQNGSKGQSLEQCKITCIQNFKFCKQHCVDNCPTCSAAAARNTAKNFARYVHEREVEGKKVMRELNSYHDPLQCHKVTCNCFYDFEICKQGCAGVIEKRLQAVPYCV